MIVKNWLTGETVHRVPADTLEAADLSGVNLSFAYLAEMSLRGAKLNGTNLQCAYLQGVDLKDANMCGADLRIPESTLQDIWDRSGAAVYEAMVCVKEEYLGKGTPAAGRMWVTLTGVLLLAGVSGAIKGAIYDDTTRWPEAGGKYDPRKNGARHANRSWWKPW